VITTTDMKKISSELAHLEGVIRLLFSPVQPVKALAAPPNSLLIPGAVPVTQEVDIQPVLLESTEKEILGWNPAPEDALRKQGVEMGSVIFGSGTSTLRTEVSRSTARASMFLKLQYSAVAVTVSGEALSVILRHKPLRHRFFWLTLSKCTSVIACRVSPKQKADLVRWSSVFLPYKTILAVGE
jgi:magnesium-transporting ATPase (P-type)